MFLKIPIFFTYTWILVICDLLADFLFSQFQQDKNWMN